MADDNGNDYYYVDPITGEKVVVADEEQHNDRYAILRKSRTSGEWKFDSSHGLKRTAELGIEFRQGQYPEMIYTIVDLTAGPIE